MKLANKFTLWFMGILILVTPISMDISQHYIHKRINNAVVERLLAINKLVAAQMQRGQMPGKLSEGVPIRVEKRQGALPAKTTLVSRSTVFNKDLNREDCRLTVASVVQVKDGLYTISSYDYIARNDDIWNGMMNGVIWKIVLIAACMVITARIVSKYTLAPFYQTLKSIQSFSLQQKEKIALPKTTTREFGELNSFVQKMTDKLSEDYRSLKEFSENASHELQTPLAVIRSKLDLLSNTQIQEDQANLVADMQEAVEKLARINRSLLLLTKLENQEFEHHEHIRFCKFTNNTLAAYQELIRLKSIRIRKNVDKNVYLKLHPMLAEMLINNLISNAIRHNVQNGYIEVSLNSQKLSIKNTGTPPKIPTEELFKRFKKGNQSSDGIGLGLAIVKQICVINGFAIRYHFEENCHQVTVSFNAQKVLYSPPATTDKVEA